MDFAKEVWTDLKNYSNYQISSNGRVWSIKSQKYLKPRESNSGYLRVGLYNDYGQLKHESIHRLVAISFIPNPDKLPYVNHKDENRLNNNVDNLEWCTAKYNSNYGDAPIKASIKKRKAIAQFDMNNNLINTFVSIQEAGRQTNIPASNICHTLKNKRNNAGGYIWKYLN